ncbi:hypothetical protein SALBM135S_03878 [Streptomyces alboniger]
MFAPVVADRRVVRPPARAVRLVDKKDFPTNKVYGATG